MRSLRQLIALFADRNGTGRRDRYADGRHEQGYPATIQPPLQPRAAMRDAEMRPSRTTQKRSTNGGRRVSVPIRHSSNRQVASIESPDLAT